MKRETGHYVTASSTGELVRAFIPAPLPPAPPIEWSPELQGAFHQALLGVGRLDSITQFLPDPSLFLYMYVRKEAVLSSQIEGTQSSLSDLLLSEAQGSPGVPMADVQEISNYVAALNHGLDRLAGGFPLSLRLFRDMHRILLQEGRGSHCTPGEFRRSQNWIGGSRPGNAVYVPPPPEHVSECMGRLELFLHNDSMRSLTLLKAALAHVQFETIHPFLDGNGRLGRLLITLLLCEGHVLKQPMLYLSLYLKTHRARYYELLTSVRTTGDWESWLLFFAKGVAETAAQAVETSERLLTLASQDRERIHGLGRATGSALKVYDALLRRPVTSTTVLTRTGIPSSTVNTCLGRLQDIGIVREITGKKRNRVYTYDEYVGILAEGAESPL
jgi:cell filamentation protein, protein adenylyltransferase